MNFLEQWFNLVPDGGDGTWEASLIALTLGVIATGLLLRHRFAHGPGLWPKSLRRHLSTLRSLLSPPR
jgi:hypothetical protein